MMPLQGHGNQSWCLQIPVLCSSCPRAVTSFFSYTSANSSCSQAWMITFVMCFASKSLACRYADTCIVCCLLHHLWYMQEGPSILSLVLDIMHMNNKLYISWVICLMIWHISMYYDHLKYHHLILKWRFVNSTTFFHLCWDLLCHTLARPGIIKFWFYYSFYILRCLIISCERWGIIRLCTVLPNCKSTLLKMWLPA
jgi:hypothetical protein